MFRSVRAGRLQGRAAHAPGMIHTPDRSRHEIGRRAKDESLGPGRTPAGWVGRLIPFEWTTTRGIQVVVLVDRTRVH